MIAGVGKSVEQAIRWEIQGGAGIVVLSPEFASLKIRQSFHVAVLRQNFFLGEASVFVLTG